ncbi:MAG: hypothetical protein WBA45_07805 [Microthrixaceae bacterium]
MGCGCLLLLAAAASPRFALFLTWLFTDRIPAAYDDNWLVTVLGFLFLPWTALAWVAVWAPVSGVSGLGWFIVVFAFTVDLSTLFGTARSERARSR